MWALFLIFHRPPVSLYTLPPLPSLYLVHATPSLSFCPYTWQRAGHHSLHLLDMLSTAPRAGDVKPRLWDKELILNVLTVAALKNTWHVLTRHCFLHFSNCLLWVCLEVLQTFLVWHFESCRWKSFEIHYLENAIGMNHRWADQTWLCILLLQCNIAHMSVKILCHLGLKNQATVNQKQLDLLSGPVDFISSSDWWGVPLYLITQRS